MAKKEDNMDHTLKMKRCQEYIEALQEEQKKIQVFERELPLCLYLVTQAIESYRKELLDFSRSEHIQSEGSERTTSECESRDGCTVLFEEFIPTKSDEHESCKRINHKEADEKKSEWLQLWNQSPTKEDQATTVVVVVETKGKGGAFQPFQKEKPTADSSQPLKAITQTLTTSSTTAETGGNKREIEQQKQLQMNRKQRRCWSPELHRRFLRALQQLGGSYVATPKQIRDLMQVDGLTNDEVKSHLQKYRLHTRRPAAPTVTDGGETPQQPQFMVVESVWVPSSHDAVNNRVYAPVAVQPPLRSSPTEPRGILRCKPPTTSSSTHKASTPSSFVIIK